MTKRTILIVLSIIAGHMYAARIDRATARTAIENWLHKNGIAGSLFCGSAVSDLTAYDSDANLWIARFSPHGYVILSGSDLLKPIIAFSKNDFSWPEEGSAFAARLNASAAATVAAEATGGVINPQWRPLISTSGMLLKSAVSIDSSRIIVHPFMTNTSWSQCQPYNDFSPVHEEQPTKNHSYRGRTPCGCVATAIAQVMAYWKWPYCAEGARAVNHDYYPNGDSGPATEFPIRFDGSIPFDWNSLNKKYPYYKNGYDLRGKVAESVRYPIARLILFADSLSQMYFAQNGSAAAYETAFSAAADWYCPAKTMSTYTVSEYSTVVSGMKSDLQNGIPVLVSIPGHAIVTHGWAESGDGTYYCYHNYGWGGENDGWYLLYGGTSEENVLQCHTGFYPKQMVQLDPLPAVCGDSVTLSWHLPDCYTNSVQGFHVTKSSAINTPTDFTDDFSEYNGKIADSDNGGLTKVQVGAKCYHSLWFDSSCDNSYTYPIPFHLTSRSELTFKLKSEYALDSRLDVQARINGDEWQTISSHELEQHCIGGWNDVRLYLGNKCGSSFQLRFALVRTGNSYYLTNYRKVYIRGLMFSDVLSEEKSVENVAATATSHTVSNLESGRMYSFNVTPYFNDCDGIMSQPVQTRVADILQTASMGESILEECAPPQIISVTGSEGYAQVAEEFYRENAMGGDVIWVKCSKNVKTLQAKPSHLALVSDEDVEVYPRGNGNFAIVINANPAKIPNRSRIILTLKAQCANGSSAYKDLSLRFNRAITGETYVPLPSIIEVPTTIFGNDRAVSIPVEWFVNSGLAEAGIVTDYTELALQDSDGDGFSNVAEYVCGTSPTDASDRLQCFIEMINGEPSITHTAGVLPDGFRATVKGTATLSSPNWQTQSNGHRFFKVVIECTDER